jgi:hypothetical protein
LNHSRNFLIKIYEIRQRVGGKADSQNTYIHIDEDTLKC